VLDAVHSALVASGVQAADLFQRVFERETEDFRFDPTYPDIKTTRTSDFVLIEILWSVVTCPWIFGPIIPGRWLGWGRGDAAA